MSLLTDPLTLAALALEHAHQDALEQLCGFAPDADLPNFVAAIHGEIEAPQLSVCELPGDLDDAGIAAALRRQVADHESLAALLGLTVWASQDPRARPSRSADRFELLLHAVLLPDGREFCQAAPLQRQTDAPPKLGRMEAMGQLPAVFAAAAARGFADAGVGSG